MPDVDLLAALMRFGGTATFGQLTVEASPRRLSRAVADGTVVRVSRGRYAFPTADDGRVAAHRLCGVSSHLRAAAYWGWSLKTQPERPWVTVAPNRRVAAIEQGRVRVSWRRLAAEDVAGWVTMPLRTVLDCAADLPFDEALAVADSALRSGRVTSRELQDAAARFPTRGRARVTAVARHATGEAANPFESVLRAICVGVPGLHVRPQVEIRSERFFARVDLADPNLRIAIEADSFAFHGTRDRLRSDCHRYDELVVAGWVVLRFAWEQVMFAPEWVAEVLTAVARSVRERSARSNQRELVARLGA